MIQTHFISDVLDQRWAEERSRVAIRECGRDLTFRELLEWSQEISSALEAFVSRPTQRVVLLLPNSAAFVSAFFAVARVGGVVCPLNTQYRSQELAYYLRDLEPVAVVTAAEFVQPVSDVMLTMNMPPALLELCAGKDIRVLRSSNLSGCSTTPADSLPLLQLCTSGSTGGPKRVVRSHTALLAEIEALHKTFGLTQADKFLGVTPFSHVNGLVRTMMASMYVGGTLYPVEGFRRREILDLLTHERISFFGGVPQMFAILSQTPLRDHVDLSTLRVVFSSSAPLIPADNRSFQARYGPFVRQLYGSTETGTISFNHHPAIERCLESVGYPLEGVYVEVVDSDGKPLSTGQEGEIAIRSPFATCGYLNNPEATNASFRGGFYFSGDLGTKDATGYLRITGRKKFIINRGGLKVNPYEVEEVIKEHPKVQDVVVFSSPSQHGDDIICAAIQTSEQCNVDEILFHCRDRIADYKIPSCIEFRDTLPRSSTGKILRSAL